MYHNLKKEIMIIRTEFLAFDNIEVDAQFTVIEDVDNKMEIVESVKIVLHQGINIVDFISDDFKEKLIEEYYKAIS